MEINGIKIKPSNGKVFSQTKQLPEGSKPMTVCLCMPGREFSLNFVKSLLETIEFFHANGIRYFVSSQYTSVVYFVRNLCLGADLRRGINQKPFDGKIDYTHLLWVDSDCVWNSKHLESLFVRNVDVVGGIYPVSDKSGYATVLLKDWDLDFYKKNGFFKFMTDEDIKNNNKDENNGLMECAYTGFGMLLMKKGVMESLEYPWFKQTLVDCGSGIQDYTSEDAACCYRLREKGFKIWVDPTIRIGHEKSIVL